MQINMLDAKNQLSKLVKSALAGEEVIIASNGEPQVKLVPCTAAPGLKNKGILAGKFKEADEAFTEKVDDEVSRLFKKL
jgi:prevent-host-death family protein